MEHTDEIGKIDGMIRHAYDIRNTDTRRSLQLCEEARELSARINYLKGKADAQNHLGFCKVQLGNYEGALTELYDSLRIYEELNNPESLGNVNYNIGLAFIRLGDFTAAHTYERKSLAYREELNDKIGIANCCMQIGYIHEHFNDLEASLAYYEKCHKLHSEMNNPLGIAAGLMCLASLYILKNDHEKVKAYMEQCLALRKSVDDPRGYAATLHRYATYHFMNDMLKEARTISEEGIGIAERMGDKMGLTRFHILYGKILTGLKEYDLALTALEKADKLARDTKLKSTEYEVHQALSEVYELMGDHRRALEHYMLFHKTREEVLNADANAKVRNIETIQKMESANREKEIERLKNVELKKAYEEIEQKNKDIHDSITYARRIQRALLASDALLRKNLPDFFVLYQPKDVVSGDFYWAISTGDRFIVVVADCTGHGVPGAFMSLLIISKLNETIREKRITRPDLVLNTLRNEVIRALNPEGSEEVSNDGMDCVLLSFDFTAKKLEYAAANNSFYVIRNKELLVCSADKMPVGRSPRENEPFTYNQVELQSGDTIYLFTDGYADQFGGEKGKKFKYKQLEELLLTNAHQPMERQKTIAGNTLEAWKGSLEQVDDVLLLGVKVE